ncbi:hypothetical protein [Epilithonimonas sp. UC225_85]|uniref:hypothetical protein n=1 Tax=Epilithonimonas sp. UC225_85 TaxID=3350167 RepID=UPI0036D2418C
MEIRRQLTLFLDEEYASEIESIRLQFNPVQYRLIKSHVTLCREDEIGNFQQILDNIHSLKQRLITINFEKIVRFSEGKGVLISAHQNNPEYHDLRRNILLSDKIRFSEPHITLMHPRNSTCTDEIFDEIKKLDFLKKIRFNTISLIEQVDGGEWKTLQKFKL